ncbi:MAG: metallophosphoesterase [Pseudomonadota bacterium]
MPIRLIHVSDTHLSRTHGYFTDNWRAFKAEMEAAPPDALVHGGDLSFNGPVAEGDLAFAAGEMASLGIPHRVISGNHDLPEEAAQMAALRDMLGTRGKRPVMLFMHMPPFDMDPDDPTRTTSVIPHPGRAALLDICVANGVKVICCGHLHIYRQMRHRGIRIIWAPATAMSTSSAACANAAASPAPAMWSGR